MILARFIKKSYLKPSCSFHIPKTNIKTWYPDAEWWSQFKGPIMLHDDIISKWKISPWNAKRPELERKVETTVLNFGPAHPSAHGCLRLITRLEGEVCI